jgi:hypothetical protein
MTSRRLLAGLCAAALLVAAVPASIGAASEPERSERLLFILLPILNPRPPAPAPTPTPAPAPTTTPTPTTNSGSGSTDSGTSGTSGGGGSGSTSGPGSGTISQLPTAPVTDGILASPLPGTNVVPVKVIDDGSTGGTVPGGSDGSAGALPDPGSAGAGTPQPGRTVGVVPEGGPVTVKLPGRGGTVSLETGVVIPVGSVIDARRNAVRLVAAKDDRGGMQSGTFTGGMFEVRQNAGPAPMTDIVLRGGNFGACPRGARVDGEEARRLRSTAGRLAKRLRPIARAAHNKHAKRRKAVRRLWGSDRSGRFRTRGSHAIATVRGTRWLTEDLCDGTRVSVSEGAVSVWPVAGGRTRLVKAGQSVLTPARD